MKCHQDGKFCITSLYLMEGFDEVSRRKQRFSHADDEHLKMIISEIGTSDWNKIASLMKNRNARQCKDRWTYYLSPALNNRKFTKEEDNLILELIKKYGKKWAQITSFFEGRTEISIKNRWNLLQRITKRRFRKYKENKKVEPEPEPIVEEPKQQTFFFEDVVQPIFHEEINIESYIDPMYDIFQKDSFDDFEDLCWEFC